MPHILLIDDDYELTGLLKELLMLEGFTVSEANDGAIGLEMIDKTVDLVLLDVMMPKLNGVETLKTLRSRHWTTPVLMLTAKGEELDRVMGLELGADDYLPKPFSERELLARIRAILRRSHPRSSEKTETLSYQNIILLPGKQEARYQNTKLDLTTTEFALLYYFVSHPATVLTKEVLSIEVLGKRLAAFDRAIDMHVSNLRKKLPPRAGGKSFIKTLCGRGYLLIEED